MGNQRQTPTQASVQKAEAKATSAGRRKPQGDELELLQGLGSNRAMNRMATGDGQGVQPWQGLRHEPPRFRGLSAELVGGAKPQGLVVQPKLVIGQPNDKYEREADRVAKEVVQHINSPSPQLTGKSPTVQRKEEEESKIQMKLTTQPFKAEGSAVSSDFENALNHARRGGQPLPPNLQTQIERSTGSDFSGVRVHNDAQADALNRRIGARAFTTGQDLFFKQGEYQPGSLNGQELIAHELAHVTQQVGSISSTSNQHLFNSGRKSTSAVQRVEDNNTSRDTAESLEDFQLEQQITDQQLKNTPKILKFIFAGSGEESWKTHKAKYRKEDLELKPAKGLVKGFKGLKYKKENWRNKRTGEFRLKTVIEYAGPSSGHWYSKGLTDRGRNSTKKNLKDAKAEFDQYMEDSEKISSLSDGKVQVDIKGFSRGGATASTFAAWIKQSNYRDKVAVNLVLIDPVHGTGIIGAGKMYHEANVSNIYEPGQSTNSGTGEPELKTGTTLLLPVTSGHKKAGAAFTPQTIKGYQRLIIAYGEGVKHSFGFGESDKSKLKYQGNKVKGMQLSSLPLGLFVVNAANMQIKRVNSWADWLIRYDDEVFKGVNKKEKRYDDIKLGLLYFFQANGKSIKEYFSARTAKKVDEEKLKRLRREAAGKAPPLS